MGKHSFAGFSELEHKIIQLRTHGNNITEMSQCLGIPKTTVHRSLCAVYRKVGISDIALLTRWAMATGLDTPLGAERAEYLPAPEPKRFKPRIKVGRLRKAGLDRIGVLQKYKMKREDEVK